MSETTINPVLEATTEAQVVEAVNDAIHTGVPLVDYGIAHEGLGHAPPQPHTLLRQRGHVIEHYRDDFAVRVAAGCTMGELHHALTDAGQFLPIDAEDAMTVGEVIAHNVYGPLRVGFGAVRDLLLGLSFVDGRGKVNRVGGRTVKNVAGYDVTRLMVGALGELGVITEATLRTSAVPPGTLGIDLSLDDPQRLDELIPQWLTTDAKPSWLMTTKDDHHYVARLAFFGSSGGCMTQLRSLESLLDRVPGVRILGTGSDTFERDRLRRAARSAWRGVAPALVKIVVPPANTGFICRALIEHPPNDPERQVEAYPAHGTTFVGGPLSPDAARRLDEQIAHIIQPVAGFRVWHRRPSAAVDIAPFAPPPEDFDILCQIKSTMDPHGIFNPGRFHLTDGDSDGPNERDAADPDANRAADAEDDS